MKNMMLQVKSFNALVIVALLLFGATSCSDEPETIIGTKDAPSWTAPEKYDMTASMTAIIKVDLSFSYPEQVAALPDSVQVVSDGDVLAAFADTACLGVADYVDGLFYLYVSGPTSSDSETKLTLRYYSKALKNNFVAPDAMVFANDAHEGSIAKPVMPKFVMEK